MGRETLKRMLTEWHIVGLDITLLSSTDQVLDLILSINHLNLCHLRLISMVLFNAFLILPYQLDRGSLPICTCDHNLEWILLLLISIVVLGEV